MAGREADRLSDGKNPNRSMRLREPTAEQRRIVGELILLGNERQRIFAEALQVEQDLRAKVIEAFRDHDVPKRIIAPAASITRQTVYRWLTEAGLHEPGREAQLKAEASENSGGDVERREERREGAEEGAD